MSDSDDAPLRIAVDTSQVEKANRELDKLAQQGAKADAGAAKIAEAGKKIDKGFDGAATSINETGKAIEGLGATAASAGARVETSQRGITDAIRRTGEAAKKSGDDIEASLKRTGKSAKELEFALRGVPAQFTDIFTSLAAGQAPMTVLLQQGGQLKDMFGGVGAAARALGGYVVGLVNPITVAAAAAGTLALAYQKGVQEAIEYRAALILTGNAAGTTASQLGDMAKAISGSIGTQGAAAAALAQLAGSGKIANDNLKSFAETAIRLEKFVGQPVKETVKIFEELAKAPVEASLKLNDSLNYLTASTYKQIKALQEQGKTTEAAAAAQKAYAEEMSRRSKEVEANLGSLEKGWNAVTGAAKKAWDTMLNVGREKTLSERMQEAANDIARTRNQLEGAGAFGSTGGGAATGGANFGGTAGLVNRLTDQNSASFDLLRRSELMESNASATGEAVQANKAFLSASEAVSKIVEKSLPNQEKFNNALKEYRQQLEAIRAQDPTSAFLKPETIRQAEAQIRRDIFGSGNSGSAGVGENEIAAFKARIDAQRLRNEELRAVSAAGGVERPERQLQALKDVLRLQKELETSISGVARARKLSALEAAKTLLDLEKEGAALEKANKVQADRVKLQERADEAYERQVEAVVKSAESINEQAAAQEHANETFGKSKTAIEQTKLAFLEYASALNRDDNGVNKYTKATEAQIDAQRRLVKALQEAEFVGAKNRLIEAGRVGKEETETLQLELGLIGQSREVRESIIAQRRVEVALAKELASIDKLNLGEGQEADAKRAQLKAAAESNALVEKQNAAAKAVLDEWQRTSDQINQSLTDALLRGFESGKGFAENFRDTLKNMFSTLVLRPVISAALNPLSSLVSSVIGSPASGGGLLGTLSTGSSLYNGYRSLGNFFNSPTGASFANMFGGGAGGAFSSSVGKGLATDAMGATVSPGASGATLNGTFSAGGFASAAGMAAALAVFAAAAGEIIANTQGEQRFGAGYSLDPVTGKVTQTFAPSGGDAQAEATKAMIAATATGIGDALKALGSSATLTGFQAAYETSSGDRGGVFSGGTLNNGVMFGETGLGSNYAADKNPFNSKYEVWGATNNGPLGSLTGVDFNGSPEKLAIDLQQSFIAAIQASFGLIPRIIQEQYKGEGFYSGTGETDPSGMRSDMDLTRWVRVYDEEMRESIRALGNMPKRIMDLILDIDPEALSAEATAEISTKLGTLFANVNGFRQIVELLPVQELRDASFDFAAGLVELQKGLEPAAANIAAYADNFYSAEEKRAQAVKNITKVLNDAGLAVTEDQVGSASRAQFRAVFEEFAGMEEAGLEVASALLSVSNAFAGITESADVAVTSIETLGLSIREQFRGIAARILNPSQLRQFNIQDVQATLASKGFNVSEEAIGGLTKESLTELLIGFDRTTEGGARAAEALLSVAGSLLDIIEAADQTRLDAITLQFGDIGSVVTAMARPVETLSEQWHRATGEIQSMTEGLARLTGTVEQTPLERLGNLINTRDGLAEGVKGIDETLAGLRIQAADPAGRAGLSQARVDSLRAAFEADPTLDSLQRWQAAALEHIEIVERAEIEALGDVNELRLQGLRSELEGINKLIDLSKRIPEFLSDLKIGGLSPLSPRDQLAEARSSFERAYAGAQAGDPDSIDRLLSSASSYLQKGQDLFGRSTTQYADIFSSVYSPLAAMGINPEELQARATTVEGEIKSLSDVTRNTSAAQILVLEGIRSVAGEKLLNLNDEVASGTQDVVNAINTLRASTDLIGDQILAIVKGNSDLYSALIGRFPDLFGGEGGESSSQALTVSDGSTIDTEFETNYALADSTVAQEMRYLRQEVATLKEALTAKQDEQMAQQASIQGQNGPALQRIADASEDSVREQQALADLNQ